MYLSFFLWTPKFFSFLCIHMLAGQMLVHRIDWKEKSPTAMHSLLLNMGMTKFYLTESKESTNVSNFYQRFGKVAKVVYTSKESHWFFGSNPPVPKESVNDCWIYYKPFDYDQEKAVDYCHYCGKLNEKSIKFTPVIAQNKACYDLHHKCAIFRKNNSRNKFCVIPTADEKYNSVTFFCFCVTKIEWRKTFTKTGISWVLSNSFRSPRNKSGLLPKEKFLYLGSQSSMQNTASQLD